MREDTGKPEKPALSPTGQKKADEKYQRQAEALRANLRRRHQQRRGQDTDAPVDKQRDRE